MEIASNKPKPLTDATPPLTGSEPKKPAEKKKGGEYEPPPTPTAAEKKGILGFYAAATAPLPNGSGGSPLLPKAPPPASPLPPPSPPPAKGGTTGNPLMDAVIPPPAQGAPQWVIAAKKPLPTPNDTVGPAVANGAGKDPEVQADVDEARDEAFREKYAEAECRAVVGIPFDFHVPLALRPLKRIAEDETGEALCTKPKKKAPFVAFSNVTQTKKPESHPAPLRPNEEDLGPKAPAYVPIPPSQGTAATSVKQKPSSTPGACPVVPAASTPANASMSGADGSEH